MWKKRVVALSLRHCFETIPSESEEPLKEVYWSCLCGEEQLESFLKSTIASMLDTRSENRDFGFWGKLVSSLKHVGRAPNETSVLFHVSFRVVLLHGGQLERFFTCGISFFAHVWGPLDSSFLWKNRRSFFFLSFFCFFACCFWSLDTHPTLHHHEMSRIDATTIVSSYFFARWKNQKQS